jgi:hypothetical protein
LKRIRRSVIALALLIAAGVAASTSYAAADPAPTATPTPTPTTTSTPDPGRVAISAGGETDYTNSFFVGSTFALPGAVLGSGPAIRASVFAGGYSYDTGFPSKQINATFVGEELDATYQYSHANLFANFSAGVRDVNTTLSPGDPNNRRAGVVVEPAAILDGVKIAGPWRADWFASYGTRLQDYEGRLGFTHALSTATRAGVETSFDGDPTYDVFRVGPYAGVNLDARSEIQISAGYAHQSARNGSAYLRFGFYHRF